MKITIITPNLNGGGAQKVAVNLANYYVSINHNVDLIVMVNSGPYLNLIDTEVNIIFLSIDKIRYAIFPLRKYLKVNKERYYLSVMRDSNIITGLASIGFKLNSLVYREASTLDKIKNLNFIKKNIWYIILQFTYNKADKIIANSNNTKDDLVKYSITSSGKIIVIVNPVLPNNFIELANEDITDKWFLDNELKVILSVGRLSTEKNYKFLIECFFQLSKVNSSARLVIIGEGNEKDNLNNLINDLNLENIVKILNFKNNIYPYFKYAHIFALTSDFEGFGNVLVEALSQGTSVISTNCHGGPKMILNNGEFGNLIPIGQKQLYVETLNKLLKINGKDTISMKHSLNFLVRFVGNKYLNVLEEYDNVC